MSRKKMKTAGYDLIQIEVATSDEDEKFSDNNLAEGSIYVILHETRNEKFDESIVASGEDAVVASREDAVVASREDVVVASREDVVVASGEDVVVASGEDAAVASD